MQGKQLKGNKELAIEIIYSKFKEFFGCAIQQEFQAERLEQFTQAIRCSPQSYEQIIFQKLSSNKKYKAFVQTIKKDSIFSALIKVANIRPIHLVPEKNITLGKNSTKLYYLPYDPNSQWNLNRIIAQSQAVQRQILKEIARKTISFTNFLQSFDDFFYDYLVRRLDTTQLIVALNRIPIEEALKNQQLKSILKDLTASDLLRVYCLFYKDKAQIGRILGCVGLPLPILFSAVAQQTRKEYYQPQLLDQLIVRSRYGLITNIGTSKMTGKGKTTFLQKLLMIKKLSLNNSSSAFHESCIDFYTKIPIKVDDKQLLVADFQGNYWQDNKYYSELLEKCIKNSSIIFIHFTQNEQDTQNLQNSSFLVKLSSLTAQKSNIFLVMRDFRITEQSREIQVQMLQNMKLIRLPMLEDPQNESIIQITMQKIRKSLSSLQINTFLNPSVFLSGEALRKYQHNQKLIKQVFQRFMEVFKNNRLQYYKIIFPNLYAQLQIMKLKQTIFQLQTKQKRDLNDNDKQLKEKINKNQTKLQKLLKESTRPMSQFLNELCEVLTEQYKTIEIFQTQLSIWKQTQTKSIKQFIILKRQQYESFKKEESNTNQQLQALKMIINESQQNLEVFDISIDTMINELIIVQQKNKKEKKKGRIVQIYYKSCHNNNIPISLIQGKTLKFGNSFLQSLFKQLHTKTYHKSQIFVVSILGSQSSAKSTLLNYIFKCNFATSVGRCTKGVYFNIIQFQQKTIIVLDTQGLLSVVARDHTFDVQIASFIMLVSDLVIINNRGQIDAILRDLLGVCVYAIDQLYPKDSDQKIQPNKLIFTIRDQMEYGQMKQRQMLGAVINYLNQNTEIDYSKYIQFTEKDIFPLQSAFITHNIGHFCVQGSNSSFGKSIGSLRSRIMDLLKKPKHASILQFYTQSLRKWEAIQNCGNNIFNFKTLYEIKVKKYIGQLFDQAKKLYYYTYLQKQQEIISQYYSKQVQYSQQILERLKKFYYQYKQNSLKAFKKHCYQRVKQKQFIKQFLQSLQQLLTLWYRDFLSRFKKRLIEFKLNQEQSNFKQQIKKKIINFSIEEHTEHQIIQWFQKQKRKLKEKIQKEMKNAEKQRQNVGKNQSSFYIWQKVEDYLRKYSSDNQVPYLNLQTLRKQYSLIETYKVYNKQFLLPYFSTNLQHIQQNQQSLKAKKKIVIYLCDFLSNCDRTINTLIKNNFSYSISELDGLFTIISEHLSQDLQILDSYIDRFREQFPIQKFRNNDRALILMRFLSSLPKKIQQAIVQDSQKNLAQKEVEQQKYLSSLQQQVRQGIKIKGNIQQISKIWLIKILQKELDRHFNCHKILIQRRLNQICSNYTPKDIMTLAMKSFQISKQKSKQRWIKCFKFLKNTPKYLKQILHESTYFKELEDNIVTAVEETNQKIMEYLHEKLIVDLSAFDQTDQGFEVNQNSVEYYEKILGIDLSAFKINNTQKILKEISQQMRNQSSLIQNKSKEYEFYRQECNRQLSEKTIKLKESIDKFIKQNINPIIIGCQEKCPGCGVKCFKTAGHIDGHSLLKQTHLLQCFKGKIYDEDSTASQEPCFTKHNINNQYMYLPQRKKRVTIKQWINLEHPRWKDHFNQEMSYSKDTKRFAQFKKIWLNIQDMMIKYKFNEMVADPSNSQRKLKENPLTQQDIINHNLIDY